MGGAPHTVRSERERERERGKINRTKLADTMHYCTVIIIYMYCTV